MVRKSGTDTKIGKRGRNGGVLGREGNKGKG